MVNLDNPFYQQTVLGNKTRGGLIDIISSLYAAINYKDTPMYQDNLEVIGGRLPKADKKIVGKPGFTEVIIMLANGYSKPVCSQDVCC